MAAMTRRLDEQSPNRSGEKFYLYSLYRPRWLIGDQTMKKHFRIEGNEPKGTQAVVRDTLRNNTAKLAAISGAIVLSDLVLRKLGGRIVQKRNNTVLDAIDASIALSDQVNKRIDKHIAQRVKPVTQAAEVAKVAFAEFLPSKISAEVRNDVTYLSPGEDLKAKQQNIIARDLAATRQSNLKRGLQLNLPNKDVADLKLKLGDDSLSKARVPDTLLQQVIRRMPQTALIANQSLLAECIAEKDAEAAIRHISNSNGDTATPSPLTKPSTSKESSQEKSPHASREQLVAEQVALQMEHTTSPENSQLRSNPLLIPC